MRFDLSEEQRDLAQHAGAFFERARAADFEAVMAEKPVADRAVWTQLAGELGLTGIAVAEDDGGGGGDLVDLAVVLEAAGRHLSTQPLLVSGGCAVAALQAGHGDQARSWLAALAAGDIIGTWADPSATADAVHAVRTQNGWVLDGQVSHVPNVEQADLVMVAARTEEGEQIFGVTRHAGGVEVQPESTLDPTRPLGTVRLVGAQAAIAHVGVAPASLRRARTVPTALLAVETAGVARGVLDIALAHARDRQQFGRAIGSFQAVKHMLADMFVDTETARDVARYGVWSIAHDVDDPQETAAVTHAYVSECALRVAASALQILGGIGYTWEHPGHLYYKRALSSARLFTTVNRELDGLAGLIGLDG